MAVREAAGKQAAAAAGGEELVYGVSGTRAGAGAGVLLPWSLSLPLPLLIAEVGVQTLGCHAALCVSACQPEME